ncbi:sulfotransferase 1 family member D1-like isoform X1 [Polypterus senegalus]|uniref:sulfotransferase 1 family member D1-like isoform X1 n=1 Tax=Polypterus senegalus TaxID=55291 RepID=UPI00196372C3|nr:sulfotransferase 1 family member D1-like isoform X1 [Polypterus senegalus]
MEGDNSYLEATALAKLRRFPLKLVKGVPLMEPIADGWDIVENFQAFPDDLIISTYPKAGTTWVQEIIDLIYNDGDAVKCQRAPTFVRIPFLEIISPPPIPSGVELLNKMPRPRIIKTHLPFHLVPRSIWENKCKVIYVARNAKDNAVSYYHFDRMNKTQPDPGTWDQYITKFIKGEVAWGPWSDHVKGYWAEKKTHQILYLFYEDLKENPRQQTVKILDFLERVLPEDIIDKIVELTSFSSMKNNPMANYTSFPKNLFDHSVSPFMRKGPSVLSSYFQWPGLPQQVRSVTGRTISPSSRDNSLTERMHAGWMEWTSRSGTSSEWAQRGHSLIPRAADRD